MFSRDICAPRLCYFPTTDISLWITTYNCRSYLHPQLLLLLQDALNCSPLFRKSFKLTALQFFTTRIPLLKIPRTYWVSVHTQLCAWWVYDWIGGGRSWYQSRLPVGIPLPHSLGEVESSHYNFFTNMAVCLTGSRHHWVVLWSFIPRLCFGTLISPLFGLNDFANSNTRFS